MYNKNGEFACKCKSLPTLLPSIMLYIFLAIFMKIQQILVLAVTFGADYADFTSTPVFNKKQIK
ncbi:MAG: hypothetical protein ABS46_00395 [Cytophagaceae bacterium SCN 52-12]|nr:MAG: hypothetical protein ABS46_00395 [Cytophagaceae bacterium SCN 52-12]